MPPPLKYVKHTRGYREYRIWATMRNRCTNPSNKDYYRYGAKGILVDPRWDSFSAFLEDMGECPDPTFSIDRIDAWGNYAPGNCRWASNKVQQNNKTNNRILTYAGLSLTVSEWAEALGIVPNTIHSRILKGWSEERILTTPTLSYNSRAKHMPKETAASK